MILSNVGICLYTDAMGSEAVGVLSGDGTDPKNQAENVCVSFQSAMTDQNQR